jgi:hypothetical protein
MALWSCGVSNEGLLEFAPNSEQKNIYPIDGQSHMKLYIIYLAQRRNARKNNILKYK